MKTCPKCGYVRQPQDEAPDYECPKCGIVYAKFRATPARSERAPVERKDGSSRRIALIVLAAAIAATAGWQWYASANAERRAAAAQVAAEAAAKDAARAREAAELVERQQAQAQRQAVEASIMAVADQYRSWRDASTLAQSTGRIALAGPVSTLQGLLRDTERMIVPPCLDRAKDLLLIGMGAEVDGFVTFMQGRGAAAESLAQAKFGDARVAFASYEAAVSACDAVLAD